MGAKRPNNESTYIIAHSTKTVLVKGARFASRNIFEIGKPLVVRASRTFLPLSHAAC